MEQTMKIEVDSTVWPRVRREAMAVVERFAVGMATTHGALHPIFEIQSDSNVKRRIIALAAPTVTSRRLGRVMRFETPTLPLSVFRMCT